ncbi:hypothetical protein BD626DRAFT_603193 [Schizophyllum amplum]|uniref:Uncharacterized protein n=1 Tax=Schizophyllum amplum TaxID=97359 RepID=A0A550C7K3_9AGAR|nr:hypothetical protein BD626DRAFT_603193 [Auriculariopsis ampla]
MIDELRLGRLNEAKHLVHLEGVVSAQKELVLAIANARVARVDRILQMCLRRGASVDTMLSMVYQAKAGLYHPKSYEEEDDLKGLLLWRLGGARVGNIAHHVFGTPAVSTLRHRSTMAKFVPSPAAPIPQEITDNLEAGFSSIDDLLHLPDAEIMHVVALEKRPRWDEKTNKILGLCRECQSKYGTDFNNVLDLKALFEDIEDGRVHLACEATVGALGLLSGNTRLYSARPVLLSGSCKNEDAERHATMIQTTLDAVNSRKQITNARIVSIASDGEARRGKALVQLTFKTLLSPSSPIYPLLSPLHLLDLHVGDDDMTADKDYKHVAFKRVRNAALRESGISVLGIQITPAIIRMHLRDAGHSAAHVDALLNASDKQDVQLAYQLEHDLAALPPADPCKREIYIETREALRLFGTLCHHLTMPYICVDLSATEQIEHLSSAAHMVLALFVHDNAKGRFIPSSLFIDLMLMIKNLLFCIAKAKVDKPGSSFYAIQLGTDRLETLFGILRTMVGNDRNLDILQLALRVTGTTEVANILARHPEWNKDNPRRLNAHAVTRDGKAIAGADHITPRLWRGDVNVNNVTLLTCWKRGRQRIEVAYPSLAAVLRMIDNTPGASILAPFGTLLMPMILNYPTSSCLLQPLPRPETTTVQRGYENSKT